MKERDVQTIFSRKNTTIGCFELKLVKKPSMPFDAVEDHQIKSLLAVELDGLSHKISDMSAGQKPFDCFRLAGIHGYVVPVWYVPRKRKTAYYIRIQDFLAIRHTVERKSLTEEMAKQIAELTLDL
jgi:hypothetical protein